MFYVYNKKVNGKHTRVTVYLPITGGAYWMYIIWGGRRFYILGMEMGVSSRYGHEEYSSEGLGVNACWW